MNNKVKVSSGFGVRGSECILYSGPHIVDHPK